MIFFIVETIIVETGSSAHPTIRLIFAYIYLVLTVWMIVLKMAVGENTLDPTKECSGDHGIGVKNVWLTDQKLFTGVYYPISK